MAHPSKISSITRFGRQLVAFIVMTAIILVVASPSRFFAIMVSPLTSYETTEGPVPYVVLLMGDPLVRTPTASELVRKGLADKLLLTPVVDDEMVHQGFWPRESAVAVAIALRAGLSHDQIVVNDLTPPISSTFEEAKATLFFLQARAKVEPANPDQERSIVIVTSWYHTARALWIYRKVFAQSGIKVYAHGVSEVPFSQENWWQSEGGMISVFVEYAKWIRYLFLY